MLSRRDLDLLRAEERCWPEDEPAEWHCPHCGHTNDDWQESCERCGGEL